MADFSFIILTYNEAQNLPKLLNSISGLNAETFILDSGSNDETLNICSAHGIQTAHHPFENHPKQWDVALSKFKINTPWIIGLDADQVVTPELYEMLAAFNDSQYKHVNGIYFNRKYYFKGKWIKHGGYYPFYLLKMFRYGTGHSDLNENMDHRFIVSGETRVWKKGHIVESNEKENNINFWLNKHNQYSDLVAEEEIERIQKIRYQTIKPNFWGSPDERTAWLKRMWWKLPRYLRPFLYYGYRMTFQLGFLDGQTGMLFHFLHGFWFRLIVDIKIEEKLANLKLRDRS